MGYKNLTVMKKSALNFGIGRVAQKLLFLAGFMLVANVVWGREFRIPNSNYSWSSWNNPIPTNNDDVRVDRNTSRTLSVDINDANCRNVTLSNSNVITINPNCSLSIDGTLNISGNNTTLTVNGAITINSINTTNNNTTPKITGSGTITINGGTLKCDFSGFTGTLVLRNNVTISNNLGGCGNYNIQADNFTATSSIPSGTYTNLTVNGHSTLCGDVTVTGT